jgi:superkiller protein 3
VDVSHQYFEEVLKIDPNDKMAQRYKISALQGLNQTEQAISECDVALAGVPGNKEMWLAKAEVLINSKRYNEALSVYDEALKLFPADEFLWISKGELLNQLKNSHC